VSAHFADWPRKVELSRQGWGTQGNFVVPFFPGEWPFHYVFHTGRKWVPPISLRMEREQMIVEIWISFTDLIFFNIFFLALFWSNSKVIFIHAPCMYAYVCIWEGCAQNKPIMIFLPFLWESNHHICWGKFLGICHTLQYEPAKINKRKLKERFVSWDHWFPRSYSGQRRNYHPCFHSLSDLSRRNLPYKFLLYYHQLFFFLFQHCILLSIVSV